MVQEEGLGKSREELEEMVESADAGSRSPGKIIAKALFIVGLCWSLFQINIATPLPFITDFLLITNIEQRAIHLAFALCLVFCYFPATKRASHKKIPFYDWFLVIA